MRINPSMVRNKVLYNGIRAFAKRNRDENGLPLEETAAMREIAKRAGYASHCHFYGYLRDTKRPDPDMRLKIAAIIWPGQEGMSEKAWPAERWG